MVLSQKSLQNETEKPPTHRSSFSLTGKLEKIIPFLIVTIAFSKNAPGHKGKDSARSISLFPDVYLTKTTHDDSPTRLPPGNWDGFFSSDSDTRIAMPYLQFSSKEKRLYHSPFIWSFDEALAKHVASQSLFAIREAGMGLENQSYQIQPNREKIEKLRGGIDLVFGMYYKLVIYSKIRINCSLEINQLKLSLENIALKIDSERVYDYENATEELFTSMNIHERVYEEFKHLLESPIKEKFIPTLMKLKKEFYAMEYLSGQHKDLEGCLDKLTKDINRVIGLVYLLKKQLDAGTKLSTISPSDVAKFEKAHKPQDLYNAFVDLTVQIRALADEANQFMKLRTMYRKYLKLLVILEVYTKNEAKLKDLQKRLFIINNRLQKKVEAQNGDFYDLFRRATSDMQAVEPPVEECNIDLKKLIDGDEECLQKPMIAEMKHHVLAVEAFVRRAELFCEELAANKNPKKANKMQENSGIYILQVEKVLRGIAYAKQVMAQIKPTVESEFLEQQNLESLEKEVRAETRELAYQVKQGNSAFDLESWSSSKVTAAVNMALSHESILKKSQKGNQKGIAFGRKRIWKKLAQIIRDRTNEKNKVYLTCRGRVESALNIRDSLTFFKSKRLWQSISSPKSHMVSIQSWSPDLKKLVQRKIYCNPDIEVYILRIVRSFVNSLADMPQKHLP